MLNSELPLFNDQVSRRKGTPDKNTFSNDATLQILGFEYQKLVAIQVCLESCRNETIYLECFGDVAKAKDTTWEVKHHTSKANLIGTSIDFWKTLRNFVKEKDAIRQFSRLILHTTARVQPGSFFYRWNDLSSVQKLEALNKVKPNKTISEMQAVVFGASADVLLDILDRFSIRSSQPDIQGKLKELTTLPAMKTVPEKYKEDVVRELIGYVTTNAIKNRRRWQIESNTFEVDFQFIVKPFIQEDIPFPIVGKEEVDVGRRDFQFIEEMKAIRYDAMIPFAVADYLRASESRIKLLEKAPAIRFRLDAFDDDLTDTLLRSKIFRCDGLSIEMLGSEEAHSQSRELFNHCTGMPKLSIQGVQEIELYFQNGRIHSIVEAGEFKWRLEEIDFESY